MESGWTTYTTENGLISNAVGALAVAPNGDLWCAYLGQDLGVSCFNGNEWVSHTKKDGLPAGSIMWTGPLAVAPDGTVWVGMFGGGVSKFDGTAWTTYTTEDGLINDKISTMTVSPSGVLWCGHGVEDGGVSSFDGEKWTAFRAADTGGIGENPILSITTDRDGMLWVGSGRVACYDGTAWKQFGYGYGAALCLAVDKDGTLWVGGAGLTSFDGQTWYHYSFEKMGAKVTGNHAANSLVLGSDGSLWVGAGDLGIFRFDGESWTNFTADDGLVDNSVMAIAIAPDGALWCATQSGISRYLHAQPAKE
jgi:ligand-binding sensor domain-containing protein